MLRFGKVFTQKNLNLSKIVILRYSSSLPSLPTEENPDLITKEIIDAANVKSVLESPEYKTRPKNAGALAQLANAGPEPLTIKYGLRPRPNDVDEENNEDKEIEMKDGHSLKEHFGLNFGKDMPTILDELHPERDRVNWPRPSVPMYGPPTRLYFIPQSWFDAFYNKTGVTGPYLFGVTFGTFLFSKEIFIINHDFPVLVSWIIIFSVVISKFGKTLNNAVEAKIWDNYESWENFRQGSIKSLEDLIANCQEKKADTEDDKLIYDAKKENIQFQLEEEYRKRQMSVYNEVLRKLNYQVALEESQKQLSHKHMVNWIIDKVHSSITPELEKTTLNQCLSNLKSLNIKI